MSDDRLKLIHDYAWNWFSYHAGQRMAAFRFFFVVMGLMAVGFHQSLGTSQFALSFCFAIASAIFAFLFWRLDQRNRELVKVSEDVLTQTELEFSKMDIIPVHIVSKVENRRSPHATSLFPGVLYSYGQIFSAIFFLVFIASLTAAGYAALKAGWICGGKL